MRSPRFTIDKGREGAAASHLQSLILFAASGCLLFIFSFAISAQKIAILAPDKAEQSSRFAEKLRDSLSAKVKVLDASLSETAFSSISLENPYNLSRADARRTGEVIGCDFFLMIQSATLRRAAIEKADYYESFSAIFLVSSRTGRLVFWKLSTIQKPSSDAAEKSLYAIADTLASEIIEKISISRMQEISEPSTASLEEIPEDGSPAAKNLKAPIPYLRLKPEYTSVAYLYNIKATVDILVDLDEKGIIIRTEIVRWAGFGLDESVTEAVRKMNWRPAMRNGMALPMRFLVRYNFKKIEKD